MVRVRRTSELRNVDPALTDEQITDQLTPALNNKGWEIRKIFVSGVKKFVLLVKVLTN